MVPIDALDLYSDRGVIDRPQVTGEELASAGPENFMQGFSLEIVEKSQENPRPDSANRNMGLKYRYDGRQIGYAGLSINPGSKTVIWTLFYPFNNVSNPEAAKRHGIGSYVGIKTITSLIDRFNLDDSYHVTHLPALEKERELQLQAIGLFEGRMPISAYVERGVAYVQKKGFKIENPFDKKVIVDQ